MEEEDKGEIVGRGGKGRKTGKKTGHDGFVYGKEQGWREYALLSVTNPARSLSPSRMETLWIRRASW